MGEEFFVFCKFAFPSMPYWPLPYRCFGC